ncbi:hypothetical protein [Larkinella terrae]|uniref:Uncharacterized protein n=1 Tax=Larkinella terrae TaxID=2025311 RepID=A0A7K0EJN3_9BACT|nr:hypothetical protein [Larkinella terrae]MRS61676.1 hypothetical protein [Larkinella terrae]
MSEEKEREIIIRDNVNNGEWDEELLAAEWDKDLLGEWGLELSGMDEAPKSRSTKDGDEMTGKIATKHKCPSCGHEFD